QCGRLLRHHERRRLGKSRRGEKLEVPRPKFAPHLRRRGRLKIVRLMRVRIPGLLRSYTNGADTVTPDFRGPAPTLSDALAELDARFPGFSFRIVDEQCTIRPHIRFF